MAKSSLFICDSSKRTTLPSNGTKSSLMFHNLGCVKVYGDSIEPL